MAEAYRIAHVLPWPEVGGTEHATLRVAEAAPEPFRHVFYCRRAARPVQELFAASGYETEVYDPVPVSYRRPIPYLRASVRLARDLRRRRIDIVHCSDLPGAHYAALAGKLAGCRVLCHVRNRYLDISRRDRPLLFPVDQFVFVSRETWKRFGYKVRAGKGTVIYDGIDLPEAADLLPDRDARQQFGIPEEACLIGMAARIAPQKDYRTLIRAAAALVREQRKIRFLLVGDHERFALHREHFAQVRRWLHEYGVGDLFLFAGYQKDMVRFLRAIDLFVLSTHEEGLPLVILEAMAYGKPVVATGVDGVPEVVVHNLTGLLYPHEDHAQLAAALCQLIRQPHMRLAFGAAGRARVQAHFSRERFTAGVQQAYRALIGLPAYSWAESMAAPAGPAAAGYGTPK